MPAWLPTMLAVLGLAAPNPLATDSTTGFVDVPKGRLSCEATGAGPAFVLIHDGLLPSETWDAQVEPFATFFRVVRYDRCRYGRSTTESDDFSQVADLRALRYDAGAALDLQEKGVEKRGPVLVRDLSYASPRGGRVPAFLVTHEDARGRPAVLFLHHGQGNRQTFLDEAVELAGLGFVSLADAPGYRGEPEGPCFEAAKERAEIEQTVVDVRRGLDLLAARPEVDGARLGYVGYPLLVQLARGDAFISRLDGALFTLAAGDPVTTSWHDGGHFELDQGPARAERRAFLLRSLAEASPDR